MHYRRWYLEVALAIKPSWAEDSKVLCGMGSPLHLASPFVCSLLESLENKQGNAMRCLAILGDSHMQLKLRVVVLDEEATLQFNCSCCFLRTLFYFPFFFLYHPSQLKKSFTTH